MTNEIDLARDALFAIDPDIGRYEWVKAGRAAKAAGLDFEDFRSWSAQSNKYDERDTRSAWKSFKLGRTQGGINAGTLFFMARQNGWKPARSRPRTHRWHTKTDRESVPRPFRIGAKLTAPQIWERCLPIAEEKTHPYIESKGGIAAGLRVVSTDSTLQVAGVSLAGALVVPVTPLGQTVPCSLQFIAGGQQLDDWRARDKPGKLNLPGASMNGVFVVGELHHGSTVYVVEGIGQAWACWQATGSASVVCFGWGRVQTVLQELHKWDPTSRLVIVPDAGKEPDAELLACEFGVEYVTMPEGWPINSDVNDLAQRDGRDALEVLLTQPIKPKVVSPEEHSCPALDVVFADQLPTEYSPPDELVEGILTVGDGSVVYGDSNSGKTFFAIDMAVAVACGAPWMGRRTEQGLVVYLAVESPSSVRGRLQAYQLHHGVQIPNFAIVQTPVNLFDDEADAEKIIELVKKLEMERGQKVRLIVGDTLSRMSAGANENAAQDMGVVIERFDRIRKECQAHFMLIHHTGKVQAHGARGWSGIRAAADTEIEITENASGRCAEITKQRDLGTKGERIGFKLSVVLLGLTKWGKPASSCVVLPTDAPAKQAKRVGEIGGAVLELLALRGTGMKKSEIVAHFAGRHSSSAVYRELKNLMQASRLFESAGVIALAKGVDVIGTDGFIGAAGAH